MPHFSTYCASKGGILADAEISPLSLARRTFTINNIAPGAISTPINAKLLNNKAELDALLITCPLGRMGTVDEVAALAAFLHRTKPLRYRVYLCRRWRADAELSRTVIVEAAAQRPPLLVMLVSSRGF